MESKMPHVFSTHMLMFMFKSNRIKCAQKYHNGVFGMQQLTLWLK